MEEFSKVRLSVLYDQWLSEDGGRLFNKRNRGMLVEVSGDEEIELPHSRFRWLSLFQIKQLLLKNAEVNPHIRGILAHV
jgi:oxidase EvaA